MAEMTWFSTQKVVWLMKLALIRKPPFETLDILREEQPLREAVF